MEYILKGFVYGFAWTTALIGYYLSLTRGLGITVQSWGWFLGAPFAAVIIVMAVAFVIGVFVEYYNLFNDRYRGVK